MKATNENDCVLPDGERDKLSEVAVGESGVSQAGWHKIESGFRCNKEYQYQHKRNIVVPEAQTKDAFGIGIGVHAGRAAWFGSGFKTDQETWGKIQEAIRKDFEKQKLPVSIEAERKTILYMEQYIDHWSIRPKPKPVGIEYLVGPVPFEPTDPLFFHRTARLDDVSFYPEAGDLLCIGELKTTSKSIHDCVNLYTLHGQPVLQYLLWQLSSEGQRKHGRVLGVMLDVIKKGYGGDKCQFGRQLVPITPRVATWYVKMMRQKLQQLSEIDWNTDTTRNIGACTRQAGTLSIACPYRALCVHGKSASVQYTFENGDSLLTWKPTDTQQTPPWE